MYVVDVRQLYYITSYMYILYFHYICMLY